MRVDIVHQLQAEDLCVGDIGGLLGNTAEIADEIGYDQVEKTRQYFLGVRFVGGKFRKRIADQSGDLIVAEGSFFRRAVVADDLFERGFSFSAFRT